MGCDLRLGSVGRDQLFIVASKAPNGYWFASSGRKLAWVLSGVLVALLILMWFVFERGGSGLFIVLLGIFSFVLLVSIARQIYRHYRLFLDFEKSSVTLSVMQRERVVATEEVKFDGVRLETNIVGGEFSVSKSVFLSILKDGKPLVFIADRLTGFPSVEKAREFLAELQMLSNDRIVRIA